MGMTFAQKVLARKAGLESIAVGQIVEIEPDICLSHDNTAAIAKKFAKIGVDRVKDPEKFVIVLDHTVPASEEKYAQNHKEIREFVDDQGIERFYDAGVGICHQVLPEEGLCPAGAADPRVRLAHHDLRRVRRVRRWCRPVRDGRAVRDIAHLAEDAGELQDGSSVVSWPSR